jgi:hypothetical protein
MNVLHSYSAFLPVLGCSSSLGFLWFFCGGERGMTLSLSLPEHSVLYLPHKHVVIANAFLHIMTLFRQRDEYLLLYNLLRWPW